MKTLNLTAFNANNVSKAIKAETFVTKIVNQGKNAQVLNQVIKAVKSKKSNATLDFFVIDGLQEAILTKALAIHNQESAAKACKHDNYHSYMAMYKKLAKEMIELSADDKKKIKAIVATAQVLKDGLLSQYAHDQISFNDLSIAYGFDQIKKAGSDTNTDTITGNDNAVTEAEAVIEAVAMPELFKAVQDLNLDDALLLAQIVAEHVAKLQAQAAEKAA